MENSQAVALHENRNKIKSSQQKTPMVISMKLLRLARQHWLLVSAGRRPFAALALVLLGFLTLLFPAAETPPVPQQPTGRQSKRAPLQLELRTDKPTHRVGDPVWLTVTLRSVSNDDYWVDRNLRIAHSDAAGVTLEIRNPNGTVLKGATLFLTVWPPSPRTAEDFVAWVHCSHTLMGMGDFIGLSTELKEHRYDLTVPGTYEIRARYESLNPIDRFPQARQQIAQAKAKLRGPVWSGVIEAEPIRLTITK